MKLIALGLLAGAAGVYVVAAWLHDRSPVFGYVAAFAEAAMVGAIADWFAVVALFRHPLGLPIPHTAIIPSNKDRIGENLATFICANFLSTEQVLAKLAQFDPAASAGGLARRSAPRRQRRDASCGGAAATASPCSTTSACAHSSAPPWWRGSSSSTSPAWWVGCST